MSGDAPAEIRDLARARSAARSGRDWAEADRLKAEIEAAGWRVVDRAGGYELEPAGAPDVVEGERVRHGRSGSVPSRLAEPVTAAVTVVATSDEATTERFLDDLATSAPAGTQLIVVSDADEAPDQPNDAVEVVWLAAGLGLGAAANAGIRRAVGNVVVMLGEGSVQEGLDLGPFVDALADPSVAIVGDRGLVSADLRGWEDASSGDVDALGPGLIAFRRDDVIARGPLEERLGTLEALAIWWSLALREEGAGSPVRRAVALAGAAGGKRARSADEGELRPRRLERRDFYRLVRRFGQDTDLLTGGQGARRPPRP